MSTFSPSHELVRPDAVYGAGDEPDVADWDESCPWCQAHWATGPERALWGRTHCWRCGFNPAVMVSGGVPTAQQVSAAEMQSVVDEAVRRAVTSTQQQMVTTLTQILGKDGLAALAERQQTDLGFGSQSSPAAAELQAKIDALTRENEDLKAAQTPPGGSPGGTDASGAPGGTSGSTGDQGPGSGSSKPSSAGS